MIIRRERRPPGDHESWQRSVRQLLAEFRCQRIDRRTFLSRAGLLAMTWTTLPVTADIPAPDAAPATTAAASADEPWRTLAAVQGHLFPAAADAPGAAVINAIGYLQWVLADSHTDPDDKRFIRNGVNWLDDIAREKHKRPFVDLDASERERVLRHVETSRAGERWLSLMLLYIFEALLSDPVYGGNPDGIGWRWLDHQPGFPRPPAGKIFPRL